MRPVILALCVFLCVGCASAGRGALVREYRTVGTAHFTVESRDVSRRTLRMIDRGLQVAGSEVERWGGLTDPVTLYVLPDQRALREAIGHPDYTWISAWARRDSVHLQSPRSWSFLPPRQQDVDRTLLHELTHVMIYQRAGDAKTWRQKQIPLWFDEGLASVTAQQAYRWPGLEDLARWYEQHPGDSNDPLRPTPELYRQHNDLVYGAGHHAVSFLVDRYGERTVPALLDAMGEGLRFDAAFEQVVGIARERFEEDFRRFVGLRGFKRGPSRRLAPKAAPMDGALQAPPASDDP